MRNTLSLAWRNLLRNRRRSLWRAMAVRNYLVGQGIDEGRIVVVGRGSLLPLDDNSTADGRAHNRRAEIRVLPVTTP